MDKSLKEVQEELMQFRDDRGWQKFHDPKSLAAAISVEAGELLEHFVWESRSEARMKAREDQGAVSDELADILILVANLANAAEVDLSEAVHRKIATNADRFPVREDLDSPPRRRK